MSQKATKKYPKIESQTYATAYLWKQLGFDLQRRVTDALGADKAIDTQFGNILGWLKSFGEIKLYGQLREAIDEHNQEQIAKRLEFDLR